MLPDKFASFNSLELGLLNEAQLAEILAASTSHARPAQLRGNSPTSLESDSTVVNYRLLDGIAVRQRLPFLDELYRTHFLELAERLYGQGFVTSPEIRNGVNVNVVEGVGARYEWHVDSNPLTGLLVVTGSTNISGGRLLFGRDRELQVALPLEVGQFLLFDARNAPHSVEPLSTPSVRVTVPMNYFLANRDIERPEGLDQALYDSAP